MDLSSTNILFPNSKTIREYLLNHKLLKKEENVEAIAKLASKRFANCNLVEFGVKLGTALVVSDLQCGECGYTSKKLPKISLSSDVSEKLEAVLIECARSLRGCSPSSLENSMEDENSMEEFVDIAISPLIGSNETLAMQNLHQRINEMIIKYKQLCNKSYKEIKNSPFSELKRCEARISGGSYDEQDEIERTYKMIRLSLDSNANEEIINCIMNAILISENTMEFSESLIFVEQFLESCRQDKVLNELYEKGLLLSKQAKEIEVKDAFDLLCEDYLKEYIERPVDFNHFKDYIIKKDAWFNEASQVCSISHEYPPNPVVIEKDGDANIYEKSVLERWIKVKAISPMSRKPVSLKDLKPANLFLEQMEERFQIYYFKVEGCLKMT